MKLPKFLTLFEKTCERDVYSDCEDDVEAAMSWLDNHPNATLEEYEAWLTHREEAMKAIRNRE